MTAATARWAISAALALVLFSNATQRALAQDPFFKGKTINLVVGYSAGGGYDQYARLAARHLGRHIPGTPNIIVQNMPGAASIKSVLYLDTVAPRDGSVITTFNFGQIGDSRMMPEKVKVDFRKFNWIGSISQDLTVCYVWRALFTRVPRTGELVFLDIRSHIANRVLSGDQTVQPPSPRSRSASPVAGIR